MKQHKWLVSLLVAFVGVLFFSFNGNFKAKADDIFTGEGIPDFLAGYWQGGAPDFLGEDDFATNSGAELTYDPDEQILTVDNGQNLLHGNDLSYVRYSKHIYYIYATNDYDNDYDTSGINDNYETLFKIKIISSDRFRVYYGNDVYDMHYWGTYTAE